MGAVISRWRNQLLSADNVQFRRAFRGTRPCLQHHDTLKNMDQELIIVTSVLSAAWGVLLLLCVVLFVQVAGLKRKVNEMSATGRIRVQKLKMDPDKNHAFHNATIAPNEELSRRGYSMYVGPEEDVESGRGTERRVGSS